MSQINEGLYSSNDQTWQTPPWLIDAILKFEGRERFDIDAATSKPFNVPAEWAYTDGWFYFRGKEQGPSDGLSLPWSMTGDELVWLNPPYGDMLKKFIKKAAEEAVKGCRIWALVPARTETIYQHEYGLTQAGFTVFIKGRLRFLMNGEDKGVAPFPTMLLYYGHDAQEKQQKWIENPPIEGTLMVRGELLNEVVQAHG